MDFLTYLLRPISSLFIPNHTVFVGNFAVGFIIALGFFLLRGHGFKKSLRHIFHNKVWNSTSAHVDYKLYIFGIYFKFFIFYFEIISAIQIARSVAYYLQSIYPYFNGNSGSYILALSVYAVSLHIIVDFFRYIQHYCMHRFDILWRFHKVHHSAEVLNPITAMRIHPFEIMLSMFRSTIVTGVWAGFFIFLTNGMLNAKEIAGVRVFALAIGLVFACIRHSHLPISFGVLRYIFVTPLIHQVHHRRDQKFPGQNFAIVFTFWDILFGTFCDATEKRKIQSFGVRGERYGGLWQALAAPFVHQKIVKQPVPPQSESPVDFVTRHG